MSKLGCFLLIVVVIALSFLEAWGIQLLWNWLAPLFWKTAPILTYWQALGCSILLSIIGSFFKSSTTKSE